MISAKEAQELAGLTEVPAFLEFIEEKIVEAAKSGNTEVIIRDNPYAMWLYNPREMPGAAKSVLKTLSDKGYHISQYYREAAFVDMGLKISWEV